VDRSRRPETPRPAGDRRERNPTRRAAGRSAPRKRKDPIKGKAAHGKRVAARGEQSRQTDERGLSFPASQGRGEEAATDRQDREAPVCTRRPPCRMRPEAVGADRRRLAKGGGEKAVPPVGMGLDRSAQKREERRVSQSRQHGGSTKGVSALASAAIRQGVNESTRHARSPTTTAAARCPDTTDGRAPRSTTAWTRRDEPCCSSSERHDADRPGAQRPPRPPLIQPMRPRLNDEKGWRGPRAPCHTMSCSLTVPAAPLKGNGRRRIALSPSKGRYRPKGPRACAHVGDEGCVPSPVTGQRTTP